jgi:hypothetical protein
VRFYLNWNEVTMVSIAVNCAIIEVSISASAPRGRTRDEGRSLGAGLQEQAPNHLKLRW